MFVEYGELSTEYYELTKPIGHSIDGDCEFYEKQLQDIEGKILEAGVGTGRMLVPLLEKGLTVDGVDLSPFMLQQCHIHLKEHALSANLYLQDLEHLNIPVSYEAIIMPTGSFCLLPTREAAHATLKHFYEHLTQGGRLIVDLLLPQDFVVGDTYTATYPLDDSSGLLFESKALKMDWIAQQTVELHRYEKWVDGQLVQTELSQFVLSWFGIQEFTMMLESCGFHLVSHCWDYETSSGKQDIVTFFASK